MASISARAHKIGIAPVHYRYCFCIAHVLCVFFRIIPLVNSGHFSRAQHAHANDYVLHDCNRGLYVTSIITLFTLIERESAARATSKIDMKDASGMI
jgi:hypothetical protein